MRVGPAARPVLLCAAALACVFALAGGVGAAGPLGIAPPEAGVSGAGGPLGGFFLWIGHWQGVIRQHLVDALHAFRSSPASGLVIIAGGFVYGVLHAAGPGHGKAVVAAYALAGPARARRAIILSFAAAMVQALSAVALVFILSLVMRATAMTMTRYTAYLETASYLAMTLLGAWLVWRALAAAPRIAAAPAGHGHHHDHDHDHHHGAGCGSCGHSHAVTPDRIDGEGWAGAWQVVLTVGLRPCTGALILLVFAASQGLFWLGVAGTFAMGLGTGLTVAVLALLAVHARDTAVRLSGVGSRAGAITEATIGAGAGLLVLMFGLVLLGGALAGA